MAIVYQHRRKDNNSVFYIGIGSNKRRAYDIHSRNRHWNSIVKKYGYDIDILFEGIEYKDACNIEIGMIKSYGRRDLKLGNLVNLTDGGEGTHGILLSDEAKEKIRKASIGKQKRLGIKHTEETKLKISLRKKKPTEETRAILSFNAKNRSKEHQDKITASKIGNSYRSKKVIDLKTNMVYNSAKEVSEIFNLNYGTLKAWLSGVNYNKSNFKYL